MAHAHPLAHDIAALAEQHRSTVLPESKCRMVIEAEVWHGNQSIDSPGTRLCWQTYTVGRTRGGAIMARPLELALSRNDVRQVADGPTCELTQAGQAGLAHDMVAFAGAFAKACDNDAKYAEVTFRLEPTSDASFYLEREVMVELEGCMTRPARSKALATATMLGMETCLGMYASLRFNVDW